MSASYSSLQKWLLLRSVSQKMLKLATENKWDELVEGEIEYVQLVESLSQEQFTADNACAPQIREVLRIVIENENEVKRLLNIRMEELKKLIKNGVQQNSLSSAYGNLSGVVLVPDAPTASQ